MKKIAIQDANILIDLVKTGLFDHCLSLQYQFSTTNIILVELFEQQQQLISPHIASGKFTIIEITAEELVEIQLIGLQDERLSTEDWSAYYYAEKQQAVLLTGDKRLKEIALRNKVEAHGILWLLDELVESHCLSVKDACLFLEEIYTINRRLPAEEFEKRKKNWSN